MYMPQPGARSPGHLPNIEVACETDALIECTVDEYNPIPCFSVTRGATDVVETFGDTPRILLIIRLLDMDGMPLPKAAYEAAGGISIHFFAAPGIVVDSQHAGRGDYLKILGTEAQINLALAGLAVVFRNPDAPKCSLQVVADESQSVGLLSAQRVPFEEETVEATIARSRTTTRDRTGFAWYTDLVPKGLPGIDSASVSIYIAETVDC